MLLRTVLFESSEGLAISQQQADDMSRVLSSLGIDPTTVVTRTDITEDAQSRKDSKASLNIAPETIALAKRFYEIGKIGEGWYYEANQAIEEGGFANEQDRVLFALLLAATSVQNEIYTNFLEASLMFNAIKQDMRENPDVLGQFVGDEELEISDVNLLSHPKYGQLNIFSGPKKAKLTSVGAKFGNIKRFLKLYLSNTLSKDVVRNMIAASVKPSDVPFDKRSPLIRKLKIANYALTLIDPGFASTEHNPFNVVVDTWMFRIFYPTQTPQGGGAGAKAFVNKLFGSAVAYANVTNAVSALAAEAGVSPHVMQAALWTGIKKTWEGDSADASNYVSAIKDMIAEYGEFWKGMQADTKNLAAVVARLDPTTVGQYINTRRADNIRGLVARTTAARHATPEWQAKDAEKTAKAAARAAKRTAATP